MYGTTRDDAVSLSPLFYDVLPSPVLSLSTMKKIEEANAEST